MVSSKNFKTRPTRAHRGLTLLEAALSMMLLAVISVAVSGLVRTGVESQLSQRTYENMQIVALNIVDDLRFDLRSVERCAPNNDLIQLGNGGNSVTFCNQNGRVTYQLVNNQMQRQIPGGMPKSYNAGFTPALNVQCVGGCFQVLDGQLQIAELQVQQAVPGSSMMDQWLVDPEFGRPTFRMANTSFALISATQFQ